MSLRLQPIALAASAAFALTVAVPALAHVKEYAGNFVPEGGGGRTGSGTLTMEYDHETNVLAILATF